MIRTPFSSEVRCHTVNIPTGNKYSKLWRLDVSHVHISIIKYILSFTVLWKYLRLKTSVKSRQILHSKLYATIITVEELSVWNVFPNEKHCGCFCSLFEFTSPTFRLFWSYKCTFASKKKSSLWPTVTGKTFTVCCFFLFSLNYLFMWYYVSGISF